MPFADKPLPIFHARHKLIENLFGCLEVFTTLLKMPEKPSLLLSLPPYIYMYICIRHEINENKNDNHNHRFLSGLNYFDSSPEIVICSTNLPVD